MVSMESIPPFDIFRNKIIFYFLELIVDPIHELWDTLYIIIFIYLILKISLVLWGINSNLQIRLICFLVCSLDFMIILFPLFSQKGIPTVSKSKSKTMNAISQLEKYQMLNFYIYCSPFSNCWSELVENN